MTSIPTTRNVRWVVMGILLGILLSVLDTNVVGTAMPSVVKALGGHDQISWVVSLYTLTMAVSTPIWGRFGDLLGRKTLFLVAIAVFIGASALCGLAQTMPELIAFRALQGIGGGGLGAGGLAIIGSLVAPRERGKYQGMITTVMAVGTVGGPLLGGVLTDYLDWRWVFFINLPIGLIALVWIGKTLQLQTARQPLVIDWAGIALLTAGITSLTFLATWAGSTLAWNSWQIISLGAVAVLSAVAFIARERTASQPLLPLRMFTQQRNFPLSIGMIVCVGVAMFGCTLYVPLFQQIVQGASATNSGLLLLPLAVPVAIVSTIAGRIMSKTGRYKIFPVIGMALLAVGLLLMATMTRETSFWLTSVYLVLIGAGLGLSMQMSSTIAQNSVETRDLGSASATSALFRTLGGSLGVAVFGSLLTAATIANPASYKDAIASGSSHIFFLAAAICAVGFALAVAVKEIPLRSANAAQQNLDEKGRA